VLSGVELFADGTEQHPGVGDVVVVDVGGATTDVYSVTSPELDDDPAAREAVATMWHSRTVEGDLGVRWNAPGIVEAARREGFLDDEGHAMLVEPAALRKSDPGYLPVTSDEHGVDRELARLASAVALRRHARPHTAGSVLHPGKDLSRVSMVIGSGGVLRYSSEAHARAIVEAAVADPAGGWRTPERAVALVDQRYVLAAAGLISRTNPSAAMSLLRNSLFNRSSSTSGGSTRRG
ncbi:MAG: glutamate mutase L, partial [Actinomycetia bacterium]|nr:glutamate mutase L [Actinomycetes bacterium]